MSIGKPQELRIPSPEVRQPTQPSLDAPALKLGSAPTAETNKNKRKKGRNALRINPQHGGTGVSPGQTGVNIPS